MARPPARVQSPRARAPRAGRAALRERHASRRPGRRSRLRDEPVAGIARDVADLPAPGLDLLAQPVRLVEVAVGPGRCAPLRELIQLGGRLLLLGKGAETEQLEAAAQEVVVAPIVHHRQGLGRVEVVVEGGCQLAPRAAWLRRVAEDLAEAV